MADSFVSKLITELTAKTTAVDTDLVPVADSNGNFFKMTWQKMKQLLLGTKDISSVGDGTVTGAISELNTNSIKVKTKEYSLTLRLESNISEYIGSVYIGNDKPNGYILSTIVTSHNSQGYSTAIPKAGLTHDDYLVTSYHMGGTYDVTVTWLYR